MRHVRHLASISWRSHGQSGSVFDSCLGAAVEEGGNKWRLFDWLKNTDQRVMGVKGLRQYIAKIA